MADNPVFQNRVVYTVPGTVPGIDTIGVRHDLVYRRRDHPDGADLLMDVYEKCRCSTRWQHL